MAYIWSLILLSISWCRVLSISRTPWVNNPVRPDQVKILIEKFSILFDPVKWNTKYINPVKTQKLDLTRWKLKIKNCSGGKTSPWSTQKMNHKHYPVRTSRQSKVSMAMWSLTRYGICIHSTTFHCPHCCVMLITHLLKKAGEWLKNSFSIHDSLNIYQVCNTKYLVWKTSSILNQII